jgi:succinate-acetate transporter protein
MPSANGGAALAETVLTGAEHGKGYFYPATAAGTPLALIAFGVTLMILSMGNAEWYNVAALGIAAPASLSLGALGLLIAGLWDFRGGNGFAATWEITYGCFWLFVGLFLGFFGAGVGAAAGPEGAGDAFGSYLFIWALVTAGFTVGTYFVARPAVIAFGLTTVVFLLLAFSNISGPSDGADTLRQLGGWVGIVTSVVVLYLAFALALNDLLGRQVLPFWPYQG